MSGGATRGGSGDGFATAGDNTDTPVPTGDNGGGDGDIISISPNCDGFDTAGCRRPGGDGDFATAAGTTGTATAAGTTGTATDGGAGRTAGGVGGAICDVISISPTCGGGVGF